MSSSLYLEKLIWKSHHYDLLKKRLFDEGTLSLSEAKTKITELSQQLSDGKYDVSAIKSHIKSWYVKRAPKISISSSDSSSELDTIETNSVPKKKRLPRRERHSFNAYQIEKIMSKFGILNVNDWDLSTKIIESIAKSTGFDDGDLFKHLKYKRNNMTYRAKHEGGKTLFWFDDPDQDSPSDLISVEFKETKQEDSGSENLDQQGFGSEEIDTLPPKMTVNVESASPEESSGDEDFDIEKIMDKRILNGKEEFFVKFKDLPDSHSRWVKRADLKSPTQKIIVASFEKKLRVDMESDEEDEPVKKSPPPPKQGNKPPGLTVITKDITPNLGQVKQTVPSFKIPKKSTPVSPNEVKPAEMSRLFNLVRDRSKTPEALAKPDDLSKRLCLVKEKAVSPTVVEDPLLAKRKDEKKKKRVSWPSHGHELRKVREFIKGEVENVAYDRPPPDYLLHLEDDDPEVSEERRPVKPFVEVEIASEIRPDIPPPALKQDRMEIVEHSDKIQVFPRTECSDLKRKQQFEEPEAKVMKPTLIDVRQSEFEDKSTNIFSYTLPQAMIHQASHDNEEVPFWVQIFGGKLFDGDNALGPFKLLHTKQIESEWVVKKLTGVTELHIVSRISARQFELAKYPKTLTLFASTLTPKTVKTFIDSGVQPTDKNTFIWVWKSGVGDLELTFIPMEIIERLGLGSQEEFKSADFIVVAGELKIKEKSQIEKILLEHEKLPQMLDNKI